MTGLITVPFRVSSTICTRATRCHTLCYMTTSRLISKCLARFRALAEGLSFDPSELHSYELTRQLTSDASPSLLHSPSPSPVRNALDLGSGDGHWVAHAALAWGGTKITGIRMPLSIDEEQTSLPGRDAENVTVLRHNLYVYMNNSAPLRTIR
jgi:hypothetical protein